MVAPKDIMEFANRFGLASQLFQSLLDKRLAPMGLTSAQLSVLSHLARRGSAQRVTDIAKTVQVGQPAVTKMLAKFETAGWITLVASAYDKRSRAAQITPKGGEHLVSVQKSLLPELGPYLMGWDKARLSQFTEDLFEFAGFLDGLGTLDEPSGKSLSNTKNEG